MTIDAFPAWVKAGHWKKVATELGTGQYIPSPVRRVEIDKPDGGKRQLGIPTITDRMIQQAIAQVLTPILDPDFSNSSFGFRPNRNGLSPSPITMPDTTSNSGGFHFHTTHNRSQVHLFVHATVLL